MRRAGLLVMESPACSKLNAPWVPSWLAFRLHKANKPNRISCHAAMDMAACAAFRKESRMKFANATNLDRKSGEAAQANLETKRVGEPGGSGCIQFRRAPGSSD
jgi:hypothetical protein